MRDKENSDSNSNDEQPETSATGSTHPGIATRLTVEEGAIIERAISFPMGLILSRYIEKMGISVEEALRHERELKRFLALCAIGHGRKVYPMGPPIDNLWHEFILSTRKYAMFCYSLCGNFIHHNPGKGDAETVSRTRTEFAVDYKHYFYEAPPPEYWGDTRYCEGDCDNGISCSTRPT